MYVMTLSDVKEYAALRVEPLDEACREWNEKALLPVGYECNNLFLTDWDETDFGSWTFMICSMFLSAGISSENPVAEWKKCWQQHSVRNSVKRV